MAAEEAIQSAVELVGKLVIEKVKFIRRVRGEVESLERELSTMKCFLKDANQKQLKNPCVRKWISDVREAARDAEDTIEMFLINVENDRSGSFLHRLTSFPKHVYRLDRIGHEIESIRRRLDDIKKTRETLGLTSLEEAKADEEKKESAEVSPVESEQQLPAWTKDKQVVGITDDVEKLLSVLKKEEKGLSVAVIHGMGGIGKSTLAREIFNHTDVVTSGKFEYHVWVVVSSKFTPQETIKKILFDLPKSEKDRDKFSELETIKDEAFRLQKLQEMLHEKLQEKSYFIVLDDVWEVEDWKRLESAFPDQQGKASKLLVTTRNKFTVKSGQYEHEMKGLDSGKGWELLLKKASVNGECPQHLKSIGLQILDKCCGLPLAISVVGGLLMQTPTKSGWEKVLHQMRNLNEESDEDKVYAILDLSYKNLSHQLKLCFLCLSFFKEDSTIPADRLVNIWEAQGLIQKNGRNTTEIARGFLDDLIKRSMLQIDEFIDCDRVKSCRLHDLLRDVCIHRAGEYMGFKIVKGGEGSSSEPSYRPRQVVVYNEDIKTFSLD